MPNNLLQSDALPRTRPVEVIVPPRALDVSVVVPTYREVENLPQLVPCVHQALRSAGYRYEIVIVDDDSKDGTKHVVADLARHIPVRVITRKHIRGLATAVTHGFDHARGRILVCMDADGSHPPDVLPDLVGPLLRDEADFAIGSRYVEGGMVDESLSVYRRWNSSLATWPARKMTGVRDPLSGFFAMRRIAYEVAGPLNPCGFKIGLALMIKCDPPRRLEVPIYFRDRTHGESKLALRTQLQYLRHLVRLARYRRRLKREDKLLAVSRA